MSRVRDVNGVNSVLISQRVYLVIFGVIATQVVAARGAYGVVTRRLDTHVNIFADSALSRGTLPARSVHRLSGLGQPASAWAPVHAVHDREEVRQDDGRQGSSAMRFTVMDTWLDWV